MRIFSVLLLATSAMAWGEDSFYAPGESLGTPPAEVVPEISGMVVSRVQEDVVWVHNDSGDGPVVYALSLSTGGLLVEAEMQDVRAKDCEDMAIGPGPDAQLDYLYLADIGNNQRKKDRFWVYRSPEPNVPARSEGTSSRIILENVETMVFAYPQPEVATFDAETLLVDPEDGEITIVTKDHDENDGVSYIFRTDGPPTTTELNRLVQVGTMSFGKGIRNRVSGGDVSADGRWVIVRSYLAARLYPCEPKQGVWEALLGPYTTIALALEPQGEAIAFERNRVSEPPAYPTFYTATELGPAQVNPAQKMRPISRYRPSTTNGSP